MTKKEEKEEEEGEKKEQKETRIKTRTRKTRNNKFSNLFCDLSLLTLSFSSYVARGR